MNILILHRIPYHKIDYHLGIDHQRHTVTYFGKEAILATLPADLRCEQVARPGVASAFEEARTWLTETPRGFDKVISLSEYELLDAALLREWLGVPGASVAQVTLVRDKVKMKQAAAAHGVRVPLFIDLPTFMARRGVVGWSGATVLKPTSGASSEDVVVFATPDAAWQALQNRRTGAQGYDLSKSPASAYQVEEFISGPIQHFDGLVENGRVISLLGSQYVGTCLDYAQGRPLGSFQFPLSAGKRSWVERALAAVGIDSGSFHLEVIANSGGDVFLEVGNRVGGADVVATYALTTGVHLPSQELRILLGEGAQLPVPGAQDGELWHGWFVFPGHHLPDLPYTGNGAAHRLDRFRQSPLVHRWQELSPGATLPRAISYQAHELPLAGVISARSHQELRNWLEALFAIGIDHECLENPLQVAS